MNANNSLPRRGRVREGASTEDRADNAPLPASPLRGERFSRFLVAACLFFACAFSLSFLYVALSTLSYPFNLEWMEGHTLDIMQRIRDGEPIYVKPSLEYVPYIYTPLYFYIAALASSFGEVDFFPARLVSVLAALGSATILYAWIRKEQGGRLIAIITAGLFFGTYILSARWFDTARVDSLYVFLTVCGLFAAIHRQTKKGAWLAGICMSLAFFTKQSALLVFLPFFAALAVTDLRFALRIMGAFALPTFIGVAYGNFISGGWFGFYVFDIAPGHAMHWGNWFETIRRDFLMPCGFFCLAMIAALLWLWPDRKKFLLYAGLCAGLFLSAYLARIHSFGWHNNLMTAHWALALMGGMALLLAPRGKSIFIALLLLAQFVTMRYDPRQFIPDAAQVRQGELFVEALSRLEGDIFIPDLQWIPRKAGKISYNFGMAAFDLFRADLGEKNHVKEELANELKEAIQNQRFAAIIPAYTNKVPQMRGYYHHAGKLPPYPRFMMGAYRQMPVDVYVPIDRREIETQQLLQGIMP